MTLDPGGVVAKVALDGSFEFISIALGTFTLTASAPGYLSAVRSDVEVTAGNLVTFPLVQLLAGLVNNDAVVNINGITAVVSNFGKTSPQPWE